MEKDFLQNISCTSEGKSKGNQVEDTKRGISAFPVKTKRNR